MIPEDLTARLADIRIPESFARFGIQDALAAVALGLIAGLFLAALVRAVTRPRPRPAEAARKAIAELSGADPQTRLAGLAALLSRHGGTAPDGLSAALYDPRRGFDPARLEAAILAAARKAGSRR